MMNRETSK